MCRHTIKPNFNTMKFNTMSNFVEKFNTLFLSSDLMSLKLFCKCEWNSFVFIAKPKPETPSVKETLRQPITAELLVEYVSCKKLDQDSFKKEFEVRTVLIRTTASGIDLDMKLYSWADSTRR